MSQSVWWDWVYWHPPSYCPMKYRRSLLQYIAKGTWKIELDLAFLDIASTPMSVGFLELVELTPLNTNWKATPFIPAPSPESYCRAIRIDGIPHRTWIHRIPDLYLKSGVEIVHRSNRTTYKQLRHSSAAVQIVASRLDGVHLSEVSTCAVLSLTWVVLKGLYSVHLFSKCSIQQ